MIFHRIPLLSSQFSYSTLLTSPGEGRGGGGGAARGPGGAAGGGDILFDKFW